MRAAWPATALRRLVLGGGLLLGVLGVFALTRLAAAAAGAAEPSPALLLAATVVVAALIPAGRPAVERVADRVAYGRAGDPHAAVAHFVSRIAGTVAVDDVLPELAHATSSAMHAERSEVRLWLADGGEWRQTWPPGAARTEARLEVPLQHAGAPVGRLDLDVTDGDLSPADRELLRRLVGPAGLALANVRLTFELRRQLARATALAEDLRRSRERLVLAGSESRRRFADTVNDRVQSRLAAADAALAAPIPEPADARTHVLAALEALRGIAAGIFPPALDDSGLATALELYLNSRPVAANLRVANLPAAPLPTAVSVATYFCCTTLLAEIGGNAPGTRPVTIDVAAEGPDVLLDIRGATPPAPDTLQLVVDRAEALGGAVTPDAGNVRIRIPIPRPEEDRR